MKSSPEKVKATLLEMERLPTIQSQLPIKFTSGAEFFELDIICPECGNACSQQSSRGTITNPITDVFVVEAHGICEECRLLVPFFHRIKLDGKRPVFEFYNDEGQWVRSPGVDKTPGFLKSITQKVIELIFGR